VILRLDSQARNVSGAIGSRVTGGVAAGAGSTGFVFCWVAGAAWCLRWSELAAPAEKAGSSRNTIAKIVDFFMWAT